MIIPRNICAWLYNNVKDISSSYNLSQMFFFFLCLFLYIWVDNDMKQIFQNQTPETVWNLIRDRSVIDQLPPFHFLN